MRFEAGRPKLLKAVIFLLSWAPGTMAGSAQQAAPPSRIDLEQAIQLAIQHNHALKPAENIIQQNEAEEITAVIRPNPVITYDDLFIRIFSPNDLNASALDSVTEFDLGFSYTFERGHKRQARINAAKDTTAVTRAQVKDNEHTQTRHEFHRFVHNCPKIRDSCAKDLQKSIHFHKRGFT